MLGVGFGAPPLSLSRESVPLSKMEIHLPTPTPHPPTHTLTHPETEKEFFNGVPTSAISFFFRTEMKQKNGEIENNTELN